MRSYGRAEWMRRKTDDQHYKHQVMAGDPYRALVAAVVLQQVKDYCGQAGDLQDEHAKATAQRSAELYLFGEGGDGPLGFKSACEFIGLNPKIVRAKLKEGIPIGVFQ